MIIFSNRKDLDDKDFFQNGGKRLSFRGHNPIYKDIKKWIDIDDIAVKVLENSCIHKFKENIVNRLLILLAEKESPPKGATDNEIKKWLKKNPREIVEVLGKRISIGGKGLMPPPIDEEIIIYNKLLDIINSCIDANSILYIKIKDDDS